MRMLSKQLGFTLVELMIATTVFSIVMLISTYSFMQINKYFAKGISMARTQDAVRNIAVDISDQIKLTPVTVNQSNPADTGWICIGNKKYIYNINIPEDGSGNALKSVELTMNDCDSSGDTKVLLAKDTRVLVFKVNPVGTNIYTVNITLLKAPKDEDPYDDTGLIDHADGTPANPKYEEWRCKSAVSGSEYCALSNITTTVLRRVNN
jgi:prepilin-type N-terminal cleavage/methylation domain-containing protein